MAVRNNPLQDTRPIQLTRRMYSSNEVHAKVQKVCYEKDFVPLQSLTSNNVGFADRNIFFAYGGTLSTMNRSYNIPSMLCITRISPEPRLHTFIVKNENGASVNTHFVLFAGAFYAYQRTGSTCLELEWDLNVLATYVIPKEYRKTLQEEADFGMDSEKVEFWYDSKKVEKFFDAKSRKSWENGIVEISKKVKCFDTNVDDLFQPINLESQNNRIERSLTDRISELDRRQVSHISADAMGFPPVLST